MANPYPKINNSMTRHTSLCTTLTLKCCSGDPARHYSKKASPIAMPAAGEKEKEEHKDEVLTVEKGHDEKKHEALDAVVSVADERTNIFGPGFLSIVNPPIPRFTVHCRLTSYAYESERA